VTVRASEPHVVPNASDIVPAGGSARDLKDEGGRPVAHFGLAGFLVGCQIQDRATVFDHSRTIYLATALVTDFAAVFVPTVASATMSLFLEGHVLITFYAMELSFHSSSS
jgi:hypothetical protein